MTIANAQQLCTEIQVGVTQEEEEEPEEMGWGLTRKHVLAIPKYNLAISAISITESSMTSCLNTLLLTLLIVVVTATIWDHFLT